jgi:hypothetical protein
LAQDGNGSDVGCVNIYGGEHAFKGIVDPKWAAKSIEDN